MKITDLILIAITNYRKGIYQSTDSKNKSIATKQLERIRSNVILLGTYDIKLKANATLSWKRKIRYQSGAPHR